MRGQLSGLNPLEVFADLPTGRRRVPIKRLREKIVAVWPMRSVSALPIVK